MIQIIYYPPKLYTQGTTKPMTVILYLFLLFKIFSFFKLPLDKLRLIVYYCISQVTQ